MTTASALDTFFSCPAYAVVGVSANRRKFGNALFRAMRDRELTVFPVHPSLETVEGDACFHSVAELPGEVTAVVTVVPPAQTELVVRECIRRGVTAVWMQNGSESERAIAEAREAGLTVVHGECLFMFLEPVRSVHGLHRWVRRLVGKYPR